MFISPMVMGGRLPGFLPLPEEGVNAGNRNKTTARNLEKRFDRGENVLDYFDLSKAGVVHPQSKGAAGKKTGLFALLYKFRDRLSYRDCLKSSTAEVATLYRSRLADTATLSITPCRIVASVSSVLNINDNGRLIWYVSVCLRLNTAQLLRLGAAEPSRRLRLRGQCDELPN
jgi:hypothetical protein